MPAGTIVQGEGCEHNTCMFAIGNHGSWGKFVAVDGILNNPNALENIYSDWNISFSCTNYEFHTLRHYLGNEWQLTIDGSLVVNEILEWPMTSEPKRFFYLFGAPQTTQASRSLCGKKRTAKIWVNGTLIYDLVPVLDETGAPGFYDRKNKKMYYNTGAGDFLFPSPVTTYSLRRVAPYVPEYAQLTPRGVRRLYRVPAGYAGSIAEYAAEHGFKRLVEEAKPADGYWSPEWRESETELRLEWKENPQPQEEADEHFGITEQELV